MSNQETFCSALADSMVEFVAFKRMQGYAYNTQAGVLQRFDRFLLQRPNLEQTLDLETVSAYLASTAGLAPSTREGRLSVVRQFSCHLRTYRPDSVVVPPGMQPRHCRNIRFYRIEPERVADLMDAAARLRPKRGVRPWCMRFLIGLLYSTGLRIAEALNLDLRDIDVQHQTLFVRHGKFGKDRLVAMSQSMTEALEVWLQRRSHWAATGPSAPLLVGRTNTRATYQQAEYAFRTLCQHCGLQKQPRPRLHDLRHNYACRCVARWREQGQDIQTLLPVLANAMGHVDIHATQVYIHVEPAALQHASATFGEHAKQGENRR